MLARMIFLLVLGALAVGAAPVPKPALAPSEIVAAAPAADWVAIAPSDLLVMDLANGKRVVIQLMPAPFSQGWVGNIRKLAAARFWDGTSINRVQDNYVVQWGDASEKKALPTGMARVPAQEYVDRSRSIRADFFVTSDFRSAITMIKTFGPRSSGSIDEDEDAVKMDGLKRADAYDHATGLWRGWPMAGNVATAWPVHCYGMVGVGRDMPPDTGTGAELYTVIGHAPRHLDRNIALVGRVIAGIEHLSSLPRGTGPLGFYEKPEERVTITSVRMGTQMKDLPAYQYLSTESASFAKYADARANRRDAFFIQPAGGADICNIPVPVRKVP